MQEQTISRSSFQPKLFYEPSKDERTGAQISHCQMQHLLYLWPTDGEVLQTAFSLIQLKKAEVQMAGTVKAAEWSQDGTKPTKEGIEGTPKGPS